MLAILIPFYKIAYFRDTLNSLSKQFDRDFEIYIFDDNSPDNVMPLINEFKGQIKIKYQKFAVNTGTISLANYWTKCIKFLPRHIRWVIILGDDDYLEPNYISLSKKIITEKENISLVIHSTNVVNSSNSILRKFVINQCFSNDFVIGKLNGVQRLSLSEMLINCSVFNEIEFRDYPLAWNSDLMFFFEVSEKYQVYYSNEITVNVRVSEHSISGNSKLEKNKSNANVMFLKDLLSEYKSSFNSQQLKFIIKCLSNQMANLKLTFRQHWFFIINASKYLLLGVIVKFYIKRLLSKTY